MRKGTNIPYVYGGLNHWFPRYDDADQDNGVRNPYTQTRMAEMLREDATYKDFTQKRDQGFGHIRLVIDPIALGLLDEKGTPLKYHVPSDAPIWQPLLEDIVFAHKASLDVVLDFHPKLYSMNHYKQWTRTYSGQTFANDDAVLAWIADHKYRGTWKQDFLSGTGVATDPLPLFWKNFATQFAAKAAIEGIEMERVYFEVLNEPFEDIGTSIGANARLVVGDYDGGPWQWVLDKRALWRNIVKATVNEIQTAIPNANVIVTPWVSFPTGHLEFTPNFTAFTPAEVPNPYNVVYSWHFYEPLLFTHRPGNPYTASTTDVIDLKYFLSRDVYGDFDGENFPHPNVPSQIGSSTGYDSPYDCDHYQPVEGDPPPIPYPPDVTARWMNSTQEYVYAVNDQVKAFSQSASATLGWYPKIVVTEFGCELRDVPGGLDPDIGQLQLGQEWLPSDTTNLQRARWLWDTRKYIENDLENSGWTVFEHVGTYMGVCSGFIYNTNDHRLHGTYGSLYPHAQQALFTNQRPGGIDD